MRLLVCTQAVDQDDRVLGFFHRWLEEFSRSFERVEVVCLKEGRHALPQNVHVHSLGKESGPSRLKYVRRFFYLVWTLRRQYDAVFVHMNQEYVLMGGLLWRLLGKRVIMWRNHKKGNLLTDIACMLAHDVCYTSPESYVAHKPRAHKMPIGIDTEQFHLSAAPAPFDTVLFLGRLDPVKKPEVFLAAIDILAHEAINCRVDGYGDPTDPQGAHVPPVREQILALEARGTLRWHSGIPHEQTPEIYRAHATYVNITPSGSFDKTIGEAMASGCVVVAANTAIRGIVPDELLVDPDSSKDVARGIEAALQLQAEGREEVVRKSVSFIEREHSLKALVGRLVNIVEKRNML
jgi:glycosyltransferase involved in cell wall biosynthesis